MQTVGAFQAKTRLSALLERVERGERITITRHGRPVAVLAPVEAEAKNRLTHAEIAADMRKIRARTKTDSASLKELIDEGRRL